MFVVRDTNAHSHCVSSLSCAYCLSICSVCVCVCLSDRLCPCVSLLVIRRWRHDVALCVYKNSVSVSPSGSVSLYLHAAVSALSPSLCLSLSLSSSLSLSISFSLSLSFCL